MLNRENALLKRHSIVNKDAPWALVHPDVMMPYECVLVYHLTPEENRGRHHVYVDVLGHDGVLRATDLKIGWSWEGRRSDEPAPAKPLDKPANEPLGNVPIEKGMNTAVWLERNGQRVSDIVSNLHARLGSDGAGNSEHHHSYYVVFGPYKRPGTVTQTESKPVVAEDRLTAILERLSELEDDVRLLKRLARI